MKTLGEYLCKIGIHKYRTNEVGFTYRCCRINCHAMYQDKYVAEAIVRAFDKDKAATNRILERNKK